MRSKARRAADPQVRVLPGVPHTSRRPFLRIQVAVADFPEEKPLPPFQRNRPTHLLSVGLLRLTVRVYPHHLGHLFRAMSLACGWMSAVCAALCALLGVWDAALLFGVLAWMGFVFARDRSLE